LLFLAAMSWRYVLVASLSSTAVASAESSGDLDPGGPGEQTSAIVGGTNAPAGKWPDTVAVVGGQGACTGTLIAPDVVITAGHCAAINPTQIVANTTNYAQQGGVRVNVTRTTAYPNWENTYDVAVVVLASPVAGVTPREVGTNCTFNGFKATTSVHLVGFGATDLQGMAANTVLKEATTAVTDPVCAGGNGCNAGVSPGGEFVAGGTGSADSCFGDSGGPVYLDTPGGPVVIGAVSRGVENAQTPCGGGGIYVRTDKIVQWLETTSGKTIAKDDCAVPPGGGEGGGTGSGTGSGSGSGSGTGGGETMIDDTDVIGGCSTTRGSGGAGVGAHARAIRRGRGGRRSRRRMRAPPPE
jgi:secreted trypsin-like serine protease